MTRAALLATTLIAAPIAATAAGIERTAPSSRILFEEGRTIELSFSHARPDLTGTGGLLDPLGRGTGDIFESFSTFGLAYKADLSPQLSYAVVVDEPYGVDTLYPVQPFSGYGGTRGRVDSVQVTGMLAYDVTEAVKVYGGLRAQRIEPSAALPFLGPLAGASFPVTYEIIGEEDWSMGYLVGAAYSRPDIALRVALTYYSDIEHEVPTTETLTSPLGAAVTRDAVDIVTPESVNLEFQSGVAADTLVFGSVRWVNWSKFVIAPTVFTPTVGQPLVNYQEDWTTYTLGVGRRFTDTWSGAVQVSWEPSADYLPLTTLGPVDGRRSIGLAATYEDNGVKVTTGLTYVKLGETRNFAATRFDDGDAVGLGIRVGYSF